MITKSCTDDHMATHTSRRLTVRTQLGWNSSRRQTQKYYTTHTKAFRVFDRNSGDGHYSKASYTWRSLNRQCCRPISWCNFWTSMMTWNKEFLSLLLLLLKLMHWQKHVKWYSIYIPKNICNWDILHDHSRAKELIFFIVFERFVINFTEQVTLQYSGY